MKYFRLFYSNIFDYFSKIFSGQVRPVGQRDDLQLQLGVAPANPALPRQPGSSSSSWFCRHPGLRAGHDLSGHHHPPQAGGGAETSQQRSGHLPPLRLPRLEGGGGGGPGLQQAGHHEGEGGTQPARGDDQTDQQEGGSGQSFLQVGENIFSDIFQLFPTNIHFTEILLITFLMKLNEMFLII